jgi:hypothetical protein
MSVCHLVTYLIINNLNVGRLYLHFRIKENQLYNLDDRINGQEIYIFPTIVRLDMSSTCIDLDAFFC